MDRKRWKVKATLLLAVVAVGFMLLYAFIPNQVFKDPYSIVLLDRHNRLLSARIASDGQWRFPESDSVPHKLKQAILTFEDRYFFSHPGVNPFSMLRAFRQNIKAKKVISGGSTLTMQVVRLSRKGKSRTYLEKLREVFLSIGLEMKFSKTEIFRMYISHAPYGGNVVGAEAAAWRYFGRPLNDLSWAEAVTLAILPNAPSMLNIGKNRELFLKKRNRLLQRLHQQGNIDMMTYSLSVDEPLPSMPVPLPDDAPHYLDFMTKQNAGKMIRSTIDASKQKAAYALLCQHHALLKGNQVNHLGIVVKSVKTGEVIVYHGNVPCYLEPEACHNDMVQAVRSSGSILKPFLYAMMLAEGRLTGRSLLADVPTWIGGFSPKNFSENYQGAITAEEALIQSLNIPFVLILRQYGLEKFHNNLKTLGITSLQKPSSHYGLSLILGGGEVKLWELTEAYAELARMISQDQSKNALNGIDAASAWLTTQTLTQLNRPETESGWQFFGNGPVLSWKTGTSFGFRDAWAVGYTPDYVMGVWAGNAEGNGRPGLTGVSAAAPLLFDLARLFPSASNWFEEPLAWLEKKVVCRESGYTPGPFCQELDTITAHIHADRLQQCPYHQLLRLDESLSWQIPVNCYPDEKVSMTAWFVLPPLMEKYFRYRNSSYKPIPEVKPGCAYGLGNVMEFVYPPPNAVIYQPIDFYSKELPIVLELTHQSTEAIIYWHLDGSFIGSTSDNQHQFPLHALVGKHVITAVDQYGNRLSCSFTILKKDI